ncbi:pilus assembly protein TadG-related protein [Arthrobacter sp. SAFR-014]|uniref:TadE/TadG family type IV pilus assembly protein n=1 Tax=unclassified Arthrobacter TaxID=235627 RepID=UPI003F7B99DA
MRRLAPSGDRERGGIAVIVAIVMVALLGFAAISIDIARLYSERAQLQNGSDAAALMIARACAAGAPAEDCAPVPSQNVRTLVNGNAVDGLTNVDSIAVDKASRTVQVTTGAKETGGSSNSVSMFFAGVLGIANQKVLASSSVQWGTPVKGVMALPLAVAECKFDLSLGSQTASEQILEFGSGCGRVPGGFGWIASTGTQCGLTMSLGTEGDASTWFSSDPGASAPSRCSAVDLSQMNDQTVLLPLYDKTADTGANAGYFVKGFAAFHVTGYNFADDAWPKGSKLKNKTIRGYFEKFVSISQALELGNATDYGASVVKLTS